MKLVLRWLALCTMGLFSILVAGLVLSDVVRLVHAHQHCGTLDGATCNGAFYTGFAIGLALIGIIWLVVCRLLLWVARWAARPRETAPSTLAGEQSPTTV